MIVMSFALTDNAGSLSNQEVVAVLRLSRQALNGILEVQKQINKLRAGKKHANLVLMGYAATVGDCRFFKDTGRFNRLTETTTGSTFEDTFNNEHSAIFVAKGTPKMPEDDVVPNIFRTDMIVELPIDEPACVYWRGYLKDAGYFDTIPLPLTFVERWRNPRKEADPNAVARPKRIPPRRTRAVAAPAPDEVRPPTPETPTQPSDNGECVVAIEDTSVALPEG